MDAKNRYKGKYVILDEGELFRYILKASNGETLLTSEPYASLQTCKNGIEILKKNLNDENLEINQDKHGLFRVSVRSKQGRILAQTSNYEQRRSALNAVESIKNFFLTDDVVEENDFQHFNEEVYDIEVELDSKGKIEIVHEDGFFWYFLKASNGQVICTSQTYSSKVSCLNAIAKFKLAVYEGKFYICKDKNTKYQFKLYNKQNRLIITGEVYDTKARVLSAIESIKRFAKLALIIE